MEKVYQTDNWTILMEAVDQLEQRGFNFTIDVDRISVSIDDPKEIEPIIVSELTDDYSKRELLAEVINNVINRVNNSREEKRMALQTIEKYIKDELLEDETVDARRMLELIIEKSNQLIINDF